jgi:hypothetical protein
MPILLESSVGYHPFNIKVLTISLESGNGTLSVGQFDWGGRLLKSNGGVQRFAQNGRKPFAEYKGKSELNCETYKSSRVEIRT